MHAGRWAVMGGMLACLPPAGVLLQGRDLAPYFDFPPRASFIGHAPFSWTVFSLIGALAAFSAAPLVKGLIQSTSLPAAPPDRHPFPWWGRAGLVWGAGAWILAWTRFRWFAALQPHTFPMLWSAFILVVNGLVQRRTGSCPMMAHPRAFAALFPASAGFWWVYEYLNRFVQNWHYSGADYPPGTYFMLATLSFATVLPAVLSVRAWLWSWPGVHGVLHGRRLPAVFTSPAAARWALAASGAGLLLTGAAPDYGFPFLWLAPPVIIMALQVQEGSCPLLNGARRGAWGALAAAALAGLVCGFFWEMWNMFSLARWTYAVPFVDRFHLFAMPLLGYAGYLPFGLTCVLVGDALLPLPGDPRSSGRQGPPGCAASRSDTPIC
jgi:hypothetical protein